MSFCLLVFTTQGGPRWPQPGSTRVSDRTKARAQSAGNQPGERVHPVVVQVMREEGVDLTSVKRQFLSEELARQATLLLTMGCGLAS